MSAIERDRQTKEQSDAAAIVACDRLSGVLTDEPGSGHELSPVTSCTYSALLGCMGDCGSVTGTCWSPRDHDKAPRRSTR